MHVLTVDFANLVQLIKMAASRSALSQQIALDHILQRLIYTSEPSAASQHATVDQPNKANPWSYRTTCAFVSEGGGALHVCGWKVLAPPRYTSVAYVLHPHRWSPVFLCIATLCWLAFGMVSLECGPAGITLHA